MKTLSGSHSSHDTLKVTSGGAAANSLRSACWVGSKFNMMPNVIQAACHRLLMGADS